MGKNTAERAIRTAIDTRTEQKGVGQTGHGEKQRKH